MKHRTKYFFNFLIIISLLIPWPLFATDFNPSFILSDEELQNWQSMNRADIQAFLENKNGYISSYHSQDWEGIRRLASDIIWRAAREHKINPKYLLVKLQKEQSLIEEKDPTQKQLDWAAGYGVCDSCSMSDPNIQKYKGFGIQVDRAAGIMRWYYDNVNEENWIKRPGTVYMIDTISVIPATYATGFLYTYTPHIHGNENFWNLWQKWFEQVYPNGTLVKTEDNSTIYVIQDGQKRAFKNMSAFITRYDLKMIITIPQSELTRYPDGSEIALPNYSILKNGDKYYLIDYDYIRPFENYDAVRSYGFNPDEIIEVISNDIKDYITGTTITANRPDLLGRLVKTKETQELFYLKDGVYHAIIDEITAKTNYPDLSIEKISISELGNYTSGDSTLLRDGTLFGVTGSNKIYVVENGKKRHIASEEVFNGLGYNWDNIIWVNQFTGMLHETGEPIYLRSSTTPSGPSDDATIIAKKNTGEPSAETVITENNGENDPVSYMVRTPEDKLNFIGPKFDTEIDSYLVAEYETGEILAGKNIDTIHPMASLTKVMTGYQLLKDGTKLYGSTTYNPQKHKSSYHMFRIVEGERIKNEHLMQAMLVSSLNTPARMLVNSEQVQDNAFAERMNKQVKEWGLGNTSFADTYGISENNKTTAREYLTLFTNATKNKDLKNYLGTRSYEYDEITDKDGQPHHFDTNSNILMQKDGLEYNIIASKTGFTYDAGFCLVMLVERKSDNKEFIVVTMGNPDFGKNTRFNAPADFVQWTMSL